MPWLASSNKQDAHIQQHTTGDGQYTSTTIRTMPTKRANSSRLSIDFFVCPPPPHRKVNNKQCSRRRELHASAASVSNRLANEPFHSSSWMMLIADVYNTPAAFAGYIVLELSRCNSMGTSDCCYVHTYEAPSHQFTGINFPSWLAPHHTGQQQFALEAKLPAVFLMFPIHHHQTARTKGFSMLYYTCR